MDTEKVINFGDNFRASAVTDHELTLHSVIEDYNGLLWGVATDEDGVPVIISGDDIDNETVVIETILPDPVPTKKGKK